MNHKIGGAAVVALLLVSLLCGCQAAPEEGPSSVGNTTQMDKMPEQVLEEQILDEDHDAFLVDTGGRLGTLLVTVERGEKAEDELNAYEITLSVWNPADMKQPIQILTSETVGWAFGTYDVADANFDGYQDFGYLYAAGVQVGTWNYWLWDESRSEFVEEPGIAEIPSPSFDSEKQIISGWSRNSAAGDGVSSFYKWIDGQLTCVRRIVVIAEYGEPSVLTVEDGINGEMVEVYRTEFPPYSEEYFDERTKWEDLNYHGEA